MNQAHIPHFSRDHFSPPLSSLGCRVVTSDSISLSWIFIEWDFLHFPILTLHTATHLSLVNLFLSSEWFQSSQKPQNPLSLQESFFGITSACGQCCEGNQEAGETPISERKAIKLFNSKFLGV